MVWKSSNPSVAVVDAGGMVMALAEGVATITVTTEDGGYSRGCVVNATSLPTYTVTYSGNGGGGIAPVDANAYLPGSMAVVLGNTFANGSYTFTGWKDAQGKLYQPGSVFEIGNADVALSAQWALAGTGHTVRYDANTPGGATAFGSVPSDAARYPAGATVTVMGNLNNLFAYDWNLAGWNTKADGTGSFYPFGGRFTMASDNVTLYGVWNESNTWRLVGSAGISAARADNPHIAIDNSGAPYIAYVDLNNAEKATVMKYNGSSWVPVGAPGFSAGKASEMELDLDAACTPFVVYRDWVNGSKATVMKYNGSAWVTVGAPGFSSDTVWCSSITVNSAGVPYVVYQDCGNGNKATVMRYTGTAWVSVGTKGFSASSVDYTHIAINSADVPYVVYRDNGNGNKATVMKYDFSGSSWVAVGMPGFSAASADYTHIAIGPDNTPYVIYSDQNRSSKATVMKFNGSSWVSVGSPGFSAGFALFSHITVDSYGTPYVSYWDGGNAGRATVMKYSGSKWISVGIPGFSAGRAAFTHIAMGRDGQPYVVYSDDANDSKAIVMKYQ